MSKDQPNTFDRDLDLYTLDEARSKTRLSIAAIIKAAADGHISLYATIPFNWEIFSCDIGDLPPCEYKKNTFSLTTKIFNQKNFGSIEHADPSLELMKLSKDDCTKLTISNQTEQCVFASGLKTSHKHHPLIATPKAQEKQILLGGSRKDFFGTLNRCFITCKRPNLRDGIIKSSVNALPFNQLEINLSMLRVAHDELFELLKTSQRADLEPQHSTYENLNDFSTTSESNNKKYPKNISHRLYTPGRARTKLLETLYYTAKNSWETRTSTGKYPKQDSIKHAIMNACPKCSESLAQKMATMISPCAEDIESESVFFLTNQFWALIDAHEKFYLHTDRKKINKKEILKNIQNHPHLLSVTNHAIQIIDSDFKANKSNLPNPPPQDQKTSPPKLVAYQPNVG